MSFFNLFKKTPEQLSPNQQKADLDSTFFNMKVKQLPHNFAQSLMDLEMKLQFSETFDMEVVQQLNDLYKRAVQYYIHEDPKKAKHFQRKLSSLLSNPQTLSLFDVKKQEDKKEHEARQNLRNQINQFNAQSNTLVTQMIEGVNKKMQKNGRMVNQHIMDQESRLKSRMEHRSHSRQARRQKAAFLSP